MEEIQAVIFDMDGVIVDSEPFHVEAEIETMKRNGVDISAGDLAKYLGTTAEFMFEDLIKRYGMNKSWEQLNQEKEAIFLPLLKEKVEPIEGVLELIDFLIKRNLKLALATSSKRDLMDVVLDKFDLGHKFDAVVCADDVEKSKPDPEIFLKAAKKIAIPPESCLVIEDAPLGVLAANRAGMTSVAYQSRSKYKQDFSKADQIVSKLLDLKNIF